MSVLDGVVGPTALNCPTMIKGGVLVRVGTAMDS